MIFEVLCDQFLLSGRIQNSDVPSIVSIIVKESGESLHSSIGNKVRAGVLPAHQQAGGWTTERRVKVFGIDRNREGGTSVQTRQSIVGTLASICLQRLCFA